MALLRARGLRSGRLRRLALELVQQAASRRGRGLIASLLLVRRRARTAKNRGRLAVDPGQDRQDKAGGKEYRRQDCRSSGKDVGGTAAGQEPPAPAPAAHAKPTPF